MELETVEEMSPSDLQAQLQLLRLQPSAVRGLRHAPAERWQQALLAAGVLTEVPPPDTLDDPDDPRVWIGALQGLLVELSALEDERDGLRSLDDRFGARDAPWWMWLLLVVQPWLAVQLGRRHADDFDRFMTLFWVYAIPGVCAAGLMLGIAVVIRRRRQERTDRLQELRGLIDRVRAELDDGATRTLSRNFAVRSGNRLMVNTPALLHADPDTTAAVEARISELQRRPPTTWLPLDS